MPANIKATLPRPEVTLRNKFHLNWFLFSPVVNLRACTEAEVIPISFPLQIDLRFFSISSPYSWLFSVPSHPGTHHACHS
jgi:hypothetical protein